MQKISTPTYVIYLLYNTFNPLQSKEVFNHSIIAFITDICCLLSPL